MEAQRIRKTCKGRKIGEFHVSVGQKIHKKCIARINLKSPFNKPDLFLHTFMKLRSGEIFFGFRKNCFLCANELSLSYRERKRNDWFQVRTHEFGSSVLEKWPWRWVGRKCKENNLKCKWFTRCWCMLSQAMFSKFSNQHGDS